MGPVGVPEMIFIFLLALVLFGPKKLPELGRTIGRAISEFRRAQNELKATLQHHMGELEKETESIRDITRSFNNDIYTNYYDSRSYNSHGYGSPSWEPGSNSSASQPAVSQPAIESSTTGASAIQGALSGSPVEANEGQLAVNGTVPRGLPAPVEPAARTEEQDSHSSAASPVES
jgi:sec-independent protein translocase protein TatA